MFMLALRLFLKDKGDGKQHCLIPFVGFNLRVETFLKNTFQKRMRYNRGLKKIVCKACLPFNCCLVIKGILNVLFSFIP